MAQFADEQLLRGIMKNTFVRKARILGDLSALAVSVIAMMSVALFTAPPLTYAQTNPSWSLTGSLNTSRSFHTATLLPNGRVLVAGGGTSTAELYDPATGTWSYTGSLNDPRAGHSATLLPNGKVLVVGGYNNDTLSIASAEIYDPATGTWSLTGSLNEGRSGFTATLLQNGKILVVGGFGESGNILDSAELYDPATGIWSATGSMHTLRDGHNAMLLQSGQVLVAGGSSDDFLTYTETAELYDPTSGTWSVTGSLHQGRVNSTATLLPDGKVLVAGGVSFVPSVGGFAPQPSNSAELYDPATGTWSMAADLKTARTYHTATLLPSGKVLVAGGHNWVPPCPCSFNNLNSVELYDPTTGTWMNTVKLKIARAFHTATLLDSGNVLAAAGSDNNSAEIYNDGRSLALAESRLPSAEAGVAYTAPLANDGISPYLLHVIKGALPAGLVFDADNGTISGTPTSAANRTFKVQVTDQTGLSGTENFTLRILRGLIIKTGALKVAVNGRPYHATLNATGGDKPYLWSLISGNLPSGLSLDTSTGKVTGTPTESGTFNFRVRLSDPIGGMTERDISLSVR